MHNYFTDKFKKYTKRNSDFNTVDGFIFVGTNFRGLNKNDTFVGFKIRAIVFSFFMFIQKITFSWVLEFVDRTFHENHENWYPTKF